MSTNCKACIACVFTPAGGFSAADRTQKQTENERCQISFKFNQLHQH